MTKIVLVTGGTGRLGARLVDRLRSAGHSVRVLSRRRGPNLCTVDWETGEGLATALTGVDLVHCASATDTLGISIEVKPADVEMDRRLAKAAAVAGVYHMIYISIAAWIVSRSRYYRIKLVVEEIVAQSGVPYTIVRATQFHDLIRSFSVSIRRNARCISRLSPAAFQRKRGDCPDGFQRGADRLATRGGIPLGGLARNTRTCCQEGE